MSETEADIREQTHIYKTVDGIGLPVDIIHSPGAQRAPAILWLHVGALIRGSRKGLWPGAGSAICGRGSR